MAHNRSDPKFCLTQGLNLVSCVVSQGKFAAWLVWVSSTFHTVFSNAFSHGEDALLNAVVRCEAASAVVGGGGALMRRSNSAAKVGNCAFAFIGSNNDT